MREIKFRAWAEKTVNNRWNYAYENSKAEIEELKKSGDEFDEQDIRHKYAQEWMKTHTEDEVYTKTTEMITDISVNGNKTVRPYGYEVLAVMQYTGLKDKNGKEVYEGDILQFSDKWEWYRHQYGLSKTREEIEQLPYGCGAVTWNERDGAWEHIGGTGDLHQYLEVIGNIYENPELIEK